MSELKTIEHKGKVYQIGAVYEFSYGDVWYVSTLISVDDRGFKTPDDVWKYIRECQSPIGAIIDAPLKLEDGEWYIVLVR